MNEMLAFMAAPFTACLVLVGIHAYFGIHVIERRVLFVDLAVAQFAALGAVVGFAMGHHPGSAGSTLSSMAFATVAAAVFALTRVRHERIPQEAIIGITFVAASAAAILIADRAPEGAEHIKETLAGSLLWVTWPTVILDLVIYAAVGALHWALRHRFTLITMDPEEAFRRGWRVRWWDFVFYLTFGIVITLSVEIGGILMVFSYLVIPACIAMLLATSMRARLLLGWVVGWIASAAGLVVSYAWDLPAGPAIVAVLGLALVAAWSVDAVRRRLPAAGGGTRSPGVDAQGPESDTTRAAGASDHGRDSRQGVPVALPASTGRAWGRPQGSGRRRHTRRPDRGGCRPLPPTPAARPGKPKKWPRAEGRTDPGPRKDGGSFGVRLATSTVRGPAVPGRSRPR